MGTCLLVSLSYLYRYLGMYLVFFRCTIALNLHRYLTQHSSVNPATMGFIFSEFLFFKKMRIKCGIFILFSKQRDKNAVKWDFSASVAADRDFLTEKI